MPRGAIPAKQGPPLENVTSALLDVCRAGLSPDRLRQDVLMRLRRAVPFDAAFWATLDPATLLFTRGHQDEIPPDTVPYFLRNEYVDEDVNRWTTLAHDRTGVRTLLQATHGNMHRSPRFRDVFEPLGLGDELRAVFRIGGVCWGCVCLHREIGAPFTTEEREYVRRLLPHVAEAIRTSLLVTSLELPQIADAPGLVVLGADGSIISTTATGERWLEELGWPRSEGTGVPTEVLALAAAVEGSGDADDDPPRLRMRTLAGRWAVLHGSRLAGGDAATAVIIEEATPSDLAAVLMRAYGLTNQERTVTSLVCRGFSTREISARLHITPTRSKTTSSRSSTRPVSAAAASSGCRSSSTSTCRAHEAARRSGPRGSSSTDPAAPRAAAALGAAGLPGPVRVSDGTRTGDRLGPLAPRRRGTTPATSDLRRGRCGGHPGGEQRRYEETPELQVRGCIGSRAPSDHAQRSLSSRRDREFRATSWAKHLSRL
jgi:hypothetical protein